MNEIIKIKGLSVRFYTYDGIVPALNDVNLDINRKETFGLVGETGCGKTLTALSILRLVPPPGKIENGSIYFNADGGGQPIDLLAISDREIRRIRGSKISMVFQEPSAALNPVYTIGNQISEVLLLHRRQEIEEKALEAVNSSLAKTDGLLSRISLPFRLMERELYQRLVHKRNLLPQVISHTPILRRLLWRLNSVAGKITIGLLREVEIPDPERVARQYPHQLSGGMKQRSVIAMALACHPRFLIADEPTTALDVTIQAQILELLRRLKVERESSILYITHDLAVAAEICDRIGVMYAGSLCEVAKVDDLFTNPQHPYTRALMAAVPKPGQVPHSIRGMVPDPLDLPPGCHFHPRCDSLTGKCSQQAPQMREVGPGHFVACHICQGDSNGNPG
jgi:peptide/nickel transport system ATP-binding protein